MTEKRISVIVAVFALAFTVAAVIAVLIHAKQADQPSGSSSAPAYTVPSADPTPVASTTESAPFVLTSAARSAELDFIVRMIRAGGYMDTDAVLYTPNGQVEGVLCGDGYFSDNPVDVHELVANYAVCDNHGGHAVLPAPLRPQPSVGAAPDGGGAGGLGPLCADGSVSGSTGRGTCSHHGGEAG